MFATVVAGGATRLVSQRRPPPHGKSWKFMSVPFVGTKTMTLKLVAGKYDAYCAPHKSVMFQHFTLR